MVTQPRVTLAAWEFCPGGGAIFKCICSIVIAVNVTANILTILPKSTVLVIASTSNW